MYGYYSTNHAAALASAFGKSSDSGKTCGVFFGDELVKFSNNHFVLESENRLAACCGYVLNDRQLTKEAGFQAFSEYLLTVPLDTALCDRLRGAYLAAVYDKGAKRLILTNDKLSKQPLYYWENKGDLLFSTSFFDLVAALKALKTPLSPDPMAVSMMVKTGALWEDFTFLKEVRYLAPFRYLSVGSEGIEEITLPFPTVNFSQDQDAAIRRIDALFSEAVRLQYEKNASEGYRQLGSISGGMDSRALLVRAEQLGYTDDLAFTYAESGSLDMEISQKVANHYGIPHMFFSMDKGGFLMDREAYVLGNEGQALYCGSTGVLRVIETLDTSRCGIVHTGISGGEIMGDIIPAEGDVPAGDVHLEKLIALLDCPDLERVERLRSQRKAYPTFNVFRQLNDIRTNTNFLRTISRQVNAASPFLYEDFYEYLMTLPIAMKGFRKLYYRWVDQALKLPYRTTDASLPTLTGTLAERYIRQECRNIQKRMGGKTRYEMNPFDVWLRENPALSEYVRTTDQADMAKLGELDPMIRSILQTNHLAAPARSQFSILTATWVLGRLAD